MIERESFPAEDGHIESILIGFDQIKVSFQTWDARQMVLLFEGAEKILLQSLTSEPRMKEQKRNLLEKYLYEFSQWEKTDVNEEGSYGYEYLDCHFEEEHR